MRFVVPSLKAAAIAGLSLFLCGSQPQPVAADLRSGPLVGHTTHHSTSIWAQEGSGKTMVLFYQIAGDPESVKTVSMPPNRAKDASIVEIDGLEHSTRYTYEITVDGTTQARGEFTTAPPTGRPVQFDYLLTSCMNIRPYKGYPNQPVWDHVLEKNPAFGMIIGDTIYLNNDDWDSNREVIFDRVWQRNLDQRDERHFANFVSKVPMYAGWNDHEYGSNNADKNQPGKQNSLNAWKSLWALPGYGTPEIAGTFYDYYWGNVHFIVLDDRWYRDQGARTQYGTAQRNWLLQKLKSSTGTFKVVVTGCDILEAGFDGDVHAIGNFVTEHKISGVMFNAGDIHRNEFKMANVGSWPYPVMQFTSSGIARDQWLRPWSIIRVDTTLEDPEMTAIFYGADTNKDDTTWSNDPNLKCSDIPGTDRFKESRCTQKVRLSELTPRGAIPDNVCGVFLESPGPGQTLSAGSEHTIVWKTMGACVDSVKLEYSTNGGGSWETVTDWMANEGSYVWNVPASASDRVKVRVLGDNSGIQHETEGFFTIRV